MTYGVARGMKNFIMITLGTGVGSGIVIDGKVVYGSDGFAGELGHFVIDHTPAGRKCGCGRSGCLETYCSATGVARTVREILENSTEPSLLRELKAEEITSYDAFLAAEKGDRLALEVFDRTGKILGTACADFTTFSTPEAPAAATGAAADTPNSSSIAFTRSFNSRIEAPFNCSIMFSVSKAIISILRKIRI